MKREDIEKAARIEREHIHKELQECYKRHKDINLYTAFSATVDKYAIPLFVAGTNWRINSVWHETKNEVPQVYGEYENESYPQIPCLVLGYLSTGYGYGVRYWNVTEKCWDDEEGDDYECDKDEIEKWAYLDDLLPNKEG